MKKSGTPPLRLLRVAALLAIPGLAASAARADGPSPQGTAPATAAAPAGRPPRDGRISLVISPRRIDRRVGADRMTADVATHEDVAAFLRHLEFEFSVYSPAIIARSGLKRVIVSGRLVLNGVEFGGMTDLDSRTIYFNAEGVAANRDSCKQIVHHEMYHLLDKADARDVRDPRWERLNGPDFRYGTRGDAVQLGGDGRGYDRDGRSPGFPNLYATASKAEDKATVFALMLAEPGALEAQAAFDPVLRAKIAEIRSRVDRMAPAESGRFWGEVRIHNDLGEVGRRATPRVAQTTPGRPQGARAASRPAK